MADQGFNVVLSNADVNAANQVVTIYKSKIVNLNSQLETLIGAETVNESVFWGEASEGYKTFYVNTVKPAVESILTLADQLNDMIKNIKVQLDGADTFIKSNNENPAGTQADAQNVN